MKKGRNSLIILILFGLILIVLLVGFFSSARMTGYSIFSDFIKKFSAKSVPIKPADLNNDGKTDTKDLQCYISGNAGAIRSDCGLRAMPATLSSDDFSSVIRSNRALRNDPRGDTNCDEVLNSDDVSPFVLALQSRTTYEQRFPNCNFMNADINRDGVVSYADINPFVQLLSSMCGDGTINGNDECDGVNLNGKSCSDFGYTGGNLACNQNCTYVFSGCSGSSEEQCGNGVVNEGEQCDSNNLNGQSCQSLGYNHGTLECTANCAININHCLSNSQQANESWVVNLDDNGQGIYGPTVDDVNGDGLKEIFAYRADGYVYGLDAHGNSLPNFPINLNALANPNATAYPYNYNKGFVTTSDIDNDGHKEIIVSTSVQILPSITPELRLFVLRLDGTVQPSWPQNGLVIGTSGAHTMIVDDLNKDGTKEIIFKSFINATTGTLNILEPNGQTFNSHFPRIIGKGLHGDSAPAVGDIDHDGIDEIVFVGDTIKTYWPDIPKVKIEAVNPEDGTEVSGWPVIVGGSVTKQRSIVIGDIENDGHLEVVASTESARPDSSGFVDSQVTVLNEDGTAHSGWPIIPVFTQVEGDGEISTLKCPGTSLQHSPSLADINNDGKLEVLFACTGETLEHGHIFAFNSSGNVLPGWPQETVDFHPGEQFSLLAADFNEDGLLEVVYSTEADNEDGDVYMWYSNGTVFPGTPMYFRAPAGYIRVGDKNLNAMISDVQNDGDIDLVFTKSFKDDYNNPSIVAPFSQVRVIDFNGAFNGKGWLTFGHDTEHTGHATY